MGMAGLRQSRVGLRFPSHMLVMWLPLLFALGAVVPVMKVEAQGSSLTNETSYDPKTNVYINCGGSGNATVDEIGVFLSDANSSPYISEGILGQNSEPSNSDDDPFPELLETARFFLSKSTYKIPVVSGSIWLRLWFYPITYVASQQTYNPDNAHFSVSANEFTLINNLTAANMKSTTQTYLYVEYLINVPGDSLSITFMPEPNAIAFVNGLGILSAPDSVLSSNPTLVPNQPISLDLKGLVALQNMFRLNVGGSAITPNNDSSYLGRYWQLDEPYLFGAVLGSPATPRAASDILYPRDVPGYTAPRPVYASARTLGGSGTTNQLSNLTWVFNVDPGYLYYVRLHFAEIVYTTVNQRVFNIFLNNRSAFQDYDVISAAGADNSAAKLDYVVNMQDGKYDKLWLALGPAVGGSSEFADVILNGLEIYKLNNTNASLQGTAVSGVPLAGGGGGGGKKSGGGNTGTIVGAAVGGLAALGVLIGGICFFCSHKSKGSAKHPSSAWLPLPLHGGNSESRTASKISTTTSHKSGTGSYVSSAASNLGRYFTFSELQEATNNFDEDLLLGVGGFGKVYKAEIDDGMHVAVKRGNPRSEQGLTEFQTEIELLSKLRHRHLVSLIGYCEEHCEMILVYDYMANGPLRGHLYGTDLPPLSWKQRLEICVGAARGLHYLHTGAAQGIIHRDVKTTNILLDDHFVAKVADFGLSKTGPSLDRTHVSTAVKGSFGYLDPEYFRRQQLTEKSDVYSFGVVLMEVVCARPAINPALPREQVNIAEWAMQWQKMGMLDQIIDPKLVGYINPESLRKFGETAEKCLAEQGIERPAMGDVLWNLEYALQLQENSMENRLMEGSTNRILELPLRNSEMEEPDLTTTNHSLGSEESEDASASAVFSQLVNPQGR